MGRHFRIGWTETCDFAPSGFRVTATRHGFPVGKRRKGAFQRDDLIAVPGQFEFADDMRAKEADDIRVNRKGKAWKYLIAGSGSSEDMSIFQYQNRLAGFCQVGCADESIMTASDNNGIIAFSRDFRMKRRCDLIHTISAFCVRDYKTAFL